METKVKLLLALLTVLLFSSCVIREPEIRPDYTKAGFQMYQNSENQIIKLTDLFDVALMLDSFIKTPDVSKPDFRKKYLPGYEVLHSNDSNYYFRIKNSTDTAYYFRTNSKSLQSVNTEWLVKGNSVFENYTIIKCKALKNWQITLNDFDNNWIQNADINFVCTEKLSPVSYQNSNFSLTGNGNLTSEGVYKQEVKISYNINDSLRHEPETLRFKNGILNITAIDLETNQTETTSAEYIDANSSEWRVKIIYNGRTQIYDRYLHYGV